MKAFLTFIIFFLSSGVVNATDQAISVVVFGVNNENVTVENNIDNLANFDSSQVTSLSIDDLYTTREGKYLRKNGYGDKVFVLPKSKVSIYAFTKNLSNEEITLYDYRLFLSRTNLNNGDLTRLGLNNDGIYQNRKYLVNTLNQELRPNESINGYELYSFDIIQPISIQNYFVNNEITPLGIKFDFTVILENSSDYDLCSISISQSLPSKRIFDQEVCISSHSSKEITYVDNVFHPVDEFIEIEPLRISDNNWHYESISTQMLSPSDTTFDATSMMVNSSVGTIRALGSTENNMTIVLIPYTLTTPKLSITNDYNLEITGITFKSKEKDSEESYIYIDILNKGFHIYEKEADITLVSENIRLKSSKINLENHYINDIKTYTLPIEVIQDSKGLFNASINLKFDGSEYDYSFEYDLKNNKIKRSKSLNPADIRRENENATLKHKTNAKLVLANQTVEQKDIFQIKGVTSGINNQTEDQVGPISNMLFRIGLVTVIIFIIIVLILIWLW